MHFNLKIEYLDIFIYLSIYLHAVHNIVLSNMCWDKETENEKFWKNEKIIS